MLLQHDNLWEKIRPDRLNTLIHVGRKTKGNYGEGGGSKKGKAMKPSSSVNSGSIFFNIYPH